MLQSDMENIVTKDTGKAYAEVNNYFNFLWRNHSGWGNILKCTYTAKWLGNGRKTQIYCLKGSEVQIEMTTLICSLVSIMFWSF
jgi:hypothetical protein